MDEARSNSLAERVVLITGAGQGIGRIYALHFAQHGAISIVAEINGSRGEAVAREIIGKGGRALAVQTDVTSPPSVQNAVDRALEAYGRVDILINNAAIFSQLTRRRFEEIPVEDWEQIMRVNVIGAALCARAVLPAMRKAKWGRIINISSSSVPAGVPFFAHYVASKAAIIGLTRALARELGPDNITVNAVLPGLTETEVENASRSEASRNKVVEMQSIKRVETPEDIVGALLFLASADSGFITGQSLVVDGGMAFL